MFVENKKFHNRKNQPKMPNDLAREIELEFAESYPILFKKQIENALFDRAKIDERQNTGDSDKTYVLCVL